MRSFLLRFAFALLPLSSIAGCEAGVGESSTSAMIAARASEPTIRFFSERDAFTSPVTSIVSTDQVRVRASGLLPTSQATLSLRTYRPQADGRGFFSAATFTTDASGTIDTGVDAPVEGSYHGVDPDGLVWSATEGPLAEGLGPDPDAAFFEVSAGGRTVAKATLARTRTSSDVVAIPVADGGLVGTLYVPSGATDRVPVVAFGGSEGGIGGGRSFAERLASWGHPALALAYFGATGVPAELSKVPLEYFEKAFQWLDSRPETRHGKAVVMGASRGGELALTVGATFPNVVGVIAHAPSSHMWGGNSRQQPAAWAYGGRPLPYVPYAAGVAPEEVSGPAGATAYVFRPVFEAAMRSASPEALQAARIAVERIHGPVLMLGGADDALWPACDFIERAMKSLESAGHVASYHDEAVCFPAAGHPTSRVGVPMTESMWASLPFGIIALGGTPEANGRAARAGHAKVKAFLERATR